MNPKRFFKRLAQLGYATAMQHTLPLAFRRAHEQGELKGLSEEDLRIWQNALLAVLREHVQIGYASRLNELIAAFLRTPIRVHRKRGDFRRDLPIVLLCVKNDRRRIELLVDHYRRNGVPQFAFLDNGSTDGTLEWMLSQPDIDVFSTPAPYSSFAKEAWINRLVAHYGFHRWYILTDSDELVVYPGMERHPFPDLLAELSARGIRRVKGLTLDMYPDAPLFSPDSPGVSIPEKYAYCDTDSYFATPKSFGSHTLEILSGGPRFRKMGVRTSLSKYPLAYFEPGTVSENAHFQFPYAPAEAAPCWFGILHYKFLPEDLPTFRRRASRASGFARGGGDYKRYLAFGADGSDSSLLYPGSLHYTTSKDLFSLPFITAPDLWKDSP